MEIQFEKKQSRDGDFSCRCERYGVSAATDQSPGPQLRVDPTTGAEPDSTGFGSTHLQRPSPIRSLSRGGAPSLRGFLGFFFGFYAFPRCCSCFLFVFLFVFLSNFKKTLGGFYGVFGISFPISDFFSNFFSIVCPEILGDSPHFWDSSRGLRFEGRREHLPGILRFL